jgi:hypothetical protein
MAVDPAGWLDTLPDELAAHVRILRRAVAEAKADPRIRALQVQGSVGRGTADRLSDLDVGLVVDVAAWPVIADDLPAAVNRLGQVVDDYYQFVPGAEVPDIFRAWAQFADGVQLDMLVLPTTRLLGSGPDGRTLYDPDGILLRTDHPARLTDAGTVAKWAFVCWGALAEVAKFLERGRAVAAAEWLSPGRQATISCWAAAHGLDYAAYSNVVAGRLGLSCPWPDGLELTYPTPDLDSVLSAALALADLQDRVDALLAERLGIPPRPLAGWARMELDRLRSAARPADSR